MLSLGILLIILGLILVVGEFFTGSGILLWSGIACIIAGVLVLIFGRSTTFQIDLWMVVLLGVLVVGILGFVVWRVRHTYKRQATTGKEDLKGNTAIVQRTLNPEGVVLFQGELWNAISSSGKIQAGEEVIITRVDGLKLSVIKKEKT